MQLILSSASIQSALKRLAPIVNTRWTTMPLLKNVLVNVTNGAISMRATDLDLDLTIGVSGSASSDGQVILDLRALAKFVKVFAKDAEATIHWDYDANRVHVSCDAVKISMPGWSVGDFPKDIALTKPKKQKVDFDAIGTVLDATSKDDARPILCGVNVNGFETAGTDSYRLYVTTGPVEVKHPLLIHHRAAEIFARIGGVRQVQSDDRWIVFHSEGMSVRSALIQGDFPPYERLLPKTEVRLLSFEEEGFGDAIGRLSALAKSLGVAPHLPIRFSGDPILAQILSVDDKPTIEQTFLGHVDSSVIAFNHQYMADATRGVPGLTHILGNGPLTPCLIEWDDDTYNYKRLIMPVRIS